ncbi:hypothetical protein FA15DRAFT_669781 [Coprinopsis marcescibilis]|uniref:LysM domain-containing protein n=1 Tax=Coprinopsis marcescibilis TaxID=230819 RepID=A0A5C3KV76_COPMA|nr:hypothetical protein FA15DRAFT_669781 [Coprinopsis marcescibilis]
MLAFVKLTIFTVLALASGVVAQPPPCLRTYEVKAGDFCDKISVEQGVSTYQLAAVNAGIVNALCTNLWVGQIICLAREGLDCSPVIKVVMLDTCESIATAAGITFERLLANNPNLNADCSNLYPDEVLCVEPPVTS